jgi:SAM-dependent methyltransferase
MPTADATAHRVAYARAQLAERENKPSEARIYDYYLGGSANFAVDRAFAERAIARIPDIPHAARENRRFLYRAVKYLIDAGVRQFVDLGSGVPSQGNVHQIAEREAPGECRVVYVDHDPIAVAHATIMLDRDDAFGRNTVVEGEILRPSAVWRDVLDTGLIDPSTPVGLLAVAVLHFVPDSEDPQQALRHYQDQLAPGSYLVLSHASGYQTSGRQRDTVEAVRKTYDDESTTRVALRDPDQLAALFGEWSILDPGVVWTSEWHPDETAQDDGAAGNHAYILAGAARK